MNVLCVPLGAAEPAGGVSIPRFKRVLVTTDLSRAGDRAIPFAYSTVGRGGEVCILHVVKRPGRSGATAAPSSPSPSQRSRKLCAQLQALIPAQAQARGVKSQVEVVEHADAATAICQAAERVGADLICMGSRGRSGLARTLLGSVTRAVAAHSLRPVLIIPSQHK